MSDYYTPNDSLMEATMDRQWLEHWRKVAQDRLSRKRTEDSEVADLRMRVALIDRVLRMLGEARGG